MSISHSKGFIQSLETVLRAAGLPFLQDGITKALKQKNNKPPKTFVEFAKTGQTRQFEDAEDPHRAITLASLGLDTTDQDAPHIWVGCRLTFEALVRQYELTHVQLIFVRGDQTLRVMMRAEWDHRDQEHGQPHWHVHSPHTDGYDANDPVDLLWAKRQQMLHLAMCAQWYESARQTQDKRHSGCARSEADAVHWVGCVLKYVQTQVSYAVRKQPKLQRARAAGLRPVDLVS